MSVLKRWCFCRTWEEMSSQWKDWKGGGGDNEEHSKVKDSSWPVCIDPRHWSYNNRHSEGWAGCVCWLVQVQAIRCQFTGFYSAKGGPVASWWQAEKFSSRRGKSHLHIHSWLPSVIQARANSHTHTHTHAAHPPTSLPLPLGALETLKAFGETYIPILVHLHCLQ